MSHLPTECKTLLEQSAYCHRVALGEKERLCQSNEREGDALDVSHLSEERQALLFERDGSSVLALLPDQCP